MFFNQKYEFKITLNKSLRFLTFLENKIYIFYIFYRNIFRKRNETIKLGDFGISVTCFDGTVHKFSDFGSPYYNAPEVIKKKSFNAKCDVWYAFISAYLI